MNKVELLNKTKAYLLEKGWVKNCFKDEDGRVCLMGAINQGNRGNMDSVNLRDEIYSDMVGTLGMSVAFWNDKEERTFNDVMDFLDEMILKAKEEPNGRE